MLDATKSRYLERFLSYLAIPSQSDPNGVEVPSTPGQWDMLHHLEAQLKDLGLVDVHLNNHGVLTAKLPSNLPAGHKATPIGWVIHVDTVDVGLSPVIHPRLIENYDGSVIVLGAGESLDPKEHPELKQYVGDDLVVTDGTSVLGADDKAAVTTMMLVLEDVIRENRPHGDVYVVFVPDEEGGLRGVRHLEFERFPVTYAYTIDACEKGELIYRTFNAGSATLHCVGQPAHPMSAKGVLVNPTLMCVDFINALNRQETPECTENEEGFIWVSAMKSGPREATVSLKIRDHNLEKYEAKKAFLKATASWLQARYPTQKITLTLKDVYGNIANAMNETNQVGLSRLRQAFTNCAVDIKDIAMRGGTDGSWLSKEGIMTMNYFTGAHNFHSPQEFMPLSSGVACMAVTHELIRLACEE